MRTECSTVPSSNVIHSQASMGMPRLLLIDNNLIGLKCILFSCSDTKKINSNLHIKTITFATIPKPEIKVYYIN